MSFLDTYHLLKSNPIDGKLASVTDKDILRIIQKERLDEQDFLALLSPAAAYYLESIAQKANRLTIQQFGKAIVLFAPLYVSDYCVNSCTYCSFSIENEFPRRKLDLNEVEREGKTIAAKGIRHIILLTGESPRQSDYDYLKDCVKRLIKHVSSITLEVQPMDKQQYTELIECGVDGLTVFQEVYNEVIYREIHRKGPKRNYLFRLDAPERACQAGMRTVTIGPLLGLDDWRKEIFFAGMHAAYLQERYPATEIGMSLPRIRPHLGGWNPQFSITDKEMVQAMLAIRLFMPRAGITLSTRETQEFRNQLIKLGVTKMSAGSSTVVGGYSEMNSGTPQFETSDERSVGEIRNYLLSQGYQPVMLDWPMFENYKDVT